MKTKSTMVLFASMIALNTFTSISAHAQRDTGNGGGAWVCRNQDGSHSVQLLDLHEGELDGLVIPRSKEPIVDQLEIALNKFAKFSPETVEKMKTFLIALPDRTHPINDSDVFQLPPPSDTKIKKMRREKDCSLQGVGRYDDGTETFTIDPLLFKVMEPTDLAALQFHEALYKVMRTGGAYVQSSMEVRKVVAAIFASAPVGINDPETGISEASSICTTHDSRYPNENRYQFYIIPMKDGSHRIQFTRIRNEKVWDLTYIDVPADANLNSKLDQGLATAERRRFDFSRDIPADASPNSAWYLGKTWSKRFFSGEGHDEGQIAEVYEGIYNTSSSFYPQLSVYLSSKDLKIQSLSGWSFARYDFIQNYEIHLGLDAEANWSEKKYSLPTTDMSCKSLR